MPTVAAETTRRLLAAAAYLALTFLLTYPLGINAASTVVGSDADTDLFIWTLAWNTHAFTAQPLTIFDANIYYPFRHTLAYSENLIGSAFFAAPVLWATGNPILALNVATLASIFLCGLGGFVLGRSLGLVAGSRVRVRLRVRVRTGALLPHLADAPDCRPMDSVRACVAARVPRRRPSPRPVARGQLLHAPGAVERARRRLSHHRRGGTAALSLRRRRRAEAVAAPEGLRSRRPHRFSRPPPSSQFPTDRSRSRWDCGACSASRYRRPRASSRRRHISRHSFCRSSLTRTSWSARAPSSFQGS